MALALSNHSGYRMTVFTPGESFIQNMELIGYTGLQGRGSPTNSNTSHQIPARVIEADSGPRRMGAGPEIGPTDPTGRSSGRDHSPFNGLARGDRNIASSRN